jgi:hypothetical protein
LVVKLAVKAIDEHNEKDQSQKQCCHKKEPTLPTHKSVYALLQQLHKSRLPVAHDYKKLVIGSVKGMKIDTGQRALLHLALRRGIISLN